MSAPRCPHDPPCTLLLQPNSLRDADLPGHVCPAVAAQTVAEWLGRHPPPGDVFTLTDGTPATCGTMRDGARVVVTLDHATAEPVAYLGLVIQRWAEDPDASGNQQQLARESRWLQAVGEVLRFARELILQGAAEHPGTILQSATAEALQRHGLPWNPSLVEWTARRVAVLAAQSDLPRKPATLERAPGGLLDVTLYTDGLDVARDPARLAALVAARGPDPAPKRAALWEGLLVSPAPPGTRPEPWEPPAHVLIHYKHPPTPRLRELIANDVRHIRDKMQYWFDVRFALTVAEDARRANRAGGRHREQDAIAQIVAEHLRDPRVLTFEGACHRALVAKGIAHATPTDRANMGRRLQARIARAPNKPDT